MQRRASAGRRVGESAQLDRLRTEARTHLGHVGGAGGWAAGETLVFARCEQERVVLRF